MISQANTSKLSRRWLLATLAGCLSASVGAATTNLADAPIGATVIVPANVILDLSVEWPTADSDAYNSVATYDPTAEYIGYFNPNFCYDYTANTSPATPTPYTAVFQSVAAYFKPNGAASSHVCSGQWSGDFLNWAMTQTIDTLRKTLTGGTRIVDSSSATILQKAYADDPANGANNPTQAVKQLSGTALISGATPFTTWSNFYVFNGFSGASFFFSGSSMTKGTQSGTVPFAGINPILTCPSSVIATGGGNNSGSPSNTTFEVTDSNGVLSIEQGCTGTTTITITAGSSFNSAVAVTAADSTNPAVTATCTPGSATPAKSGNFSCSLTVSATSAASIGTSTLTISGKSGATTKTATLSVVVLASNVANTSAIYTAQSAVQVCTSAELSGSNSDLEGATDVAGNSGRCRGYPYGSSSPTVYKPIGLVQKYAAETSATTSIDSIRYSAFGYMLDPENYNQTNNVELDGGVMRARMKSVGPYMANPGQSVIVNNVANNSTSKTSAEWNTADGTFVANPDSNDATSTPKVTNGGNSATTNGVTGSGVINYLNQFGFSIPFTVPITSAGPYPSTGQSAYKQNDSVSELYYMATRYYRNLGNLKTHTSTAAAITSGQATNDGFPVIESWDDAIAYACSTNYIVGIGDIHTLYDADVPGSGLTTSEVSPPTDDLAVNATTATNAVATLEHAAGYTGKGGTLPGASANTTCSSAPAGSTQSSAGTCGDYIEATGLGNSYVDSMSRPSGGWGSNNHTFFIAGLAYDAHVRDIRPDITNKSKPVTVSTFWLDVMENGGPTASSEDYEEKNQYWLAAKYGGFNTSDSSFKTIFGATYSNGYPVTEPTSGALPGTAGASITYPTAPGYLPVSSWNTGGYVDDHGNYAPDQYYQAGSPSKMAAGLNSAFAKIVANIPQGTSTALSLGSSAVAASGNVNYTASFATDYSGNVERNQLTVTIASSGVVTTTAALDWQANQWLPNKATPITGITPLTAAASTTAGVGRVIATSSAVGAGNGVAFEAGSISAAELATLVAPSGTTGTSTQILNYVRGDQTNEGAAPKFRARTYTLGDITNSKPVVQEAPSLPYADSPLNPGYSTFKTNQAGRTAVVYVGANDGMLHAFDGTATGGKELFAYVPSFLFTSNVDSQSNPVGLASLVANPLQHHFMVDSQATIIDVDFARTRASGAAPASSVASDWHSIVISGLGKGGGSNSSGVASNGFFALDVTTPSSLTTESALATSVLWETSSSRSSGPAHMGYSYGTPLVVKTANYGWTVVLTSGYNNDNGQGYIYLVSPKDGSVYETISTGAGSPSSPAGLTFVSGYINDFADYTADSLYAGDLLGNVWRVDLTTAAPATVTKIATLLDGSSNPQPITTEPVVETDPATLTRYVFVGTGRLLADSDLVSSSQQTFYALVDGNNVKFDTTDTFPITRSNLASDSSPATGVTLTSSQRGYYIDLPTVAASAGLQAAADRVNVQPVASGGVVTFAGNLFGQNPCSTGTSDLYALSYAGTSLLANSAGTTVASLGETSPITSLSIVSGTAGMEVLAGLNNSDGTGTVTGFSLKNPGASLQKLNWREVQGN